MASSLNLTLPLKQDAESQQHLQQLAAEFSEHIQPAIEAALAKSELVHFARLLVIDNKYMQILTEFDGDPMQYTEYFRQELGPVFKAIFSLVEGAPPWEELNNPNAFYEYTHTCNLRALGDSAAADPEYGYLFSAFGDTTVREMKKQLAQSS